MEKKWTQLDLYDLYKEDIQKLNTDVIQETNTKDKRKEDVPKEKSTTCHNRDVILFFSFDIVNSSVYKTINSYGWYGILIKIFDKLRDDVNEEMGSPYCNVDVWRVMGDEIIFIMPVDDVKTISSIMYKIFKILIKNIKYIKSGKLFDELAEDKNNVTLMKQQNVISLQGAAWIAVVTKDIEHGEFDCKDSENIFKCYECNPGRSVYEFVGADIDTGFRLKKMTQERRLVISFELAYLLSRNSEQIQNINVISYKKLKGIWNEKLYPIIWYHNDEIYDNISFKESFYFDERNNNELICNYFSFSEKENHIEAYMYNDIFKAFEKILKDRNLKEKIELIEKAIPKSSGDNFINGSAMEYHCAAVCYKIENEEIKILVNKIDREELYCVKVKNTEKISETLAKEYSQKYNIKIDVVLDYKLAPVPITITKINEDDKNFKCIVIVAKVEGNVENNMNVELITKSELEKYNNINNVTIMLDAFDIIERYEKRRKEWKIS